MHTYGRNILDIADELTTAYVEVFTGPPFEHRDRAQTGAAFRTRLETDAARDGFQAWVERSDDGQIAGFLTGWTTPAPFRTDRAYGSVLDRIGPEQVEELLIGAFEVDELGVLPRARGTGLARRLLETATRDRSRAWLLAWNQNHDALAFYRHLGWHEPEVRGPEHDIVVFTTT
ncbi:GNAT family N-acetyltransferase [Kribbella solani]|uniref:GNAT family N-acetyltransferase n=1 Tax=Kribbella solani TaxID=236067 RepID=UPI0029BC03C7|nr:GNAT family N-acetyltransferase [Kribbella solani]MDX2969519.1 GNAT family N-acetyltransferase [Kribbella solani]MDX3006121.1 GNAT family N-acetyltransferase [Kribbella solani]